MSKILYMPIDVFSINTDYAASKSLFSNSLAKFNSSSVNGFALEAEMAAANSVIFLAPDNAVVIPF